MADREGARSTPNRSKQAAVMSESLVVALAAKMNSASSGSRSIGDAGRRSVLEGSPFARSDRSSRYSSAVMVTVSPGKASLPHVWHFSGTDIFCPFRSLRSHFEGASKALQFIGLPPVFAASKSARFASRHPSSQEHGEANCIGRARTARTASLRGWSCGSILMPPPVNGSRCRPSPLRSPARS